MLEFIKPDWPVPAHVQAYATTRQGGVSQPPYDQFNLAEHVGDDPVAVAHNRQLLQEQLALPTQPVWLQQTHSAQVVAADQLPSQLPQADASFTYQPNTICIIATADCLPILICDRAGTYVAAIHAGWRGLANGIITNTLKTFTGAPTDLLAWLGPAISAKVYEVGQDVYSQCTAFLPSAAQAFSPNRPGHWQVDLYALATQQLQQQGITAIYGGGYCTYTECKRFFSYRRDHKTGRIASLIWLAARQSGDDRQ